MRKFKRYNEKKTGRRGSRRFGRSSDRNRRDFGRLSFKKRMHKVICDKCGQSCEVPFKPTEGKAIYCRDCFRKENPRKGSDYGSHREFRPKQKGSESRQESGTELQQINAKLDKILEILNK